MTGSWAETVRLVETRADQRCEYCRMHKRLQGSSFHVEHILPKSKSGSDHPDNLAWVCAACNLGKSNRTEIVDPESGQLVRFFNPRVDLWSDHFRYDDYRVVGLTAIGRATIEALNLNEIDRLFIRQVESFVGLFPG